MTISPDDFSRRQFLTAGAALGGGLVVGALAPFASRRALAAGSGNATYVGAWVRIGTDESVTILIGAAEMGQGVLTALPQILGEELRVDWTKVRAEHAPVNPVYNNPFFHAQATGGSTSVRAYYTLLRQAGAAAREMLLQAAAAAMGAPEANLIAANGVITLTGTNQSMTYGQLAPAAAKLTPPANPPLTSASAFQLIGKAVLRTDLGPKVDGSAIFGIDVRVPGMVYAAIKHCPKLGGTVVDPGPVPSGALAVVPLGNAVGVVAGSTYQAFQAAQQAQPQWSIPASSANIDSAIIQAGAVSLMANGPAAIAETVGAPADAFAKAATVYDWTYSLPYLAHACLEPLNCTASVTPASCEIWAPTQAITGAAAIAAKITGLPASAITVHTTFLGGGLGRKGEQDFVSQAVTISKAIGKPVHLTWRREEDFTNDFYRPTALSRIQVAVDSSGTILGWRNRIVSPSIFARVAPAAVAKGVDSQAVEGAIGLPYNLGARLVDYVMPPDSVPVGFWRSVGSSINAFTTESAIDELALALKTDPVAFRRQLLASNDRVRAVLDAAAALGNWGAALPPGSARGVALHVSFGTIVAQVAQISQSGSGITVDSVACAVDCGQVINPDTVEAQMQSGIVHGLASALWGKIGFVAGAADTRNFNNYRMLRLREMPKISVQIIASTQPPGGIGEPGVPPVAPAIANAYAALTGTRLRSLPLFPQAAGAGGGEGGDSGTTASGGRNGGSDAGSNTTGKTGSNGAGGTPTEGGDD